MSSLLASSPAVARTIPLSAPAISPASSSHVSLFLPNIVGLRVTSLNLVSQAKPRTASCPSAVSRLSVVAGLTGENPEWQDDDYIPLGLAHCFVKDEASKLQDVFVIEAIPAGALECMDNGGVTCYKHVTGTTLGVALQMNASLLPAEFKDGVFAEDFDFRTKCAARTWKRQHPQEELMGLVPLDTVRSDFNFLLEDKRVLNMENVVSDSDNIKQDLSIDVYGRAKEENEGKEIEKLYNL